MAVSRALGYPLDWIRRDFIKATLVIAVRSASGIPNSDLLDKSDPYVKVKLGRFRHRTTTKPDTLDPVWEPPEEFQVTGRCDAGDRARSTRTRTRHQACSRP